MPNVKHSEDQRRFSKAGWQWFFAQVAVCAVNSVLLPQRIINGVIFFALVPPAVSAIQVLLTSALLRKIKSRNKAACMLLGALLGFIVPIGLGLLVASLPEYSDFNAVVAWVMVGCWISLLGGGLIGGAWLGHARWKLFATGGE